MAAANGQAFGVKALGGGNMRALLGILVAGALMCLSGCFRGDSDAMERDAEKSRKNLQEIQEAYDRFEKKEPSAAAPVVRPKDE
jgi:hypothetical protein